jgi:uncharacterized protein DUF2845
MHMKKSVLVGCGATLLGASPLFAQPFQCPGGIVNIGDTREAVVAQCGPPTAVQEWDQVRTQEMEFADGGFAEPAIVYPQQEWIYNYGPTRFTTIVRFRDGRVSQILEGAYGY